MMAENCREKDRFVPLYKLEDKSPTLPGDDEFWIAPDAHIIGDIRVGADVGIWFGAVLRGDNEPITLGDGTNVQENTVMHTDIGFPLTIGQGCTIGHKAMLHGCTIGENSLIGMGAIVLNGAKIGANSIVGAGALVTEGKEFPDNSLIVGSPAKKIRDLDAQAEQMLLGSASHYIENWKRFAKGLKRLD